jgi:predicted neutral ceramidase superfamily lipid hydrolase
MATEATLVRIGGLHLLLVTLLASALGGRAASVLVGGLAIGGAMLAYWGIARGLLGGVSRIWLIALAALKIMGYLVLVTAGLAGALTIDALAFAAGVSCFPAAVVAGSLTAGIHWRTIG